MGNNSYIEINIVYTERSRRLMFYTWAISIILLLIEIAHTNAHFTTTRTIKHINSNIEL